MSKPFPEKKCWSCLSAKEGNTKKGYVNCAYSETQIHVNSVFAGNCSNYTINDTFDFKLQQIEKRL